MFICSVNQYELSIYIFKYAASSMTRVLLSIYIWKSNEVKNPQFLRRLSERFVLHVCFAKATQIAKRTNRYAFCSEFYRLVLLLSRFLLRADCA